MTTPHARQMPLWPAAVRSTRRDASPSVAWLELARVLPAHLGVEFSREHGWRVIVVDAEMRRSLELLDIYEGDVVPDSVLLERRRRATEAQLLLDQAQAVLRAVQTDIEAAAAIAESVA